MSDIDSNAAERFGGGIQNSEGWGSAAQLWVSDTVIRGNNAYAGGGINTNATADLVNDNIWGNQARGASQTRPTGMGGGIRNTGTLRVANSTINGNYASGFTAARLAACLAAWVAASTPTTGVMRSIPAQTSCC